MKFNHKLEIIYVITCTTKLCVGSKTIGEVEGKLSIFVNRKLFFDEENILLLELAIILHRWHERIERDEIIDFYYESMDYEDKPILQFVHGDRLDWYLSSVWQKFSCISQISLEELIQAVECYIFNLKYELQVKYNLAVENLFENSIVL